MNAAPAPLGRRLRAVIGSNRRDVGRARSDAPPAKPKTVRIWLWLPLTPVWLVLSPLALIAAPLVRLTRQGRDIRPYRAAFAIGGLLLALSGTTVRVQAPGAHIDIRIF